MKIIGKQIAAARGLIGMSQAELAKLAGITPEALNRFEGGQTKKPHRTTVDALRRVLEERNVEFLNGGSPGVRLINYSSAE